MDTDSPTSVPVEPPLPSPGGAPPTRRRSMLGLPARLALLVLLAVAAFVAAIAGYADHRLATAAESRAQQTATTAAEQAASGFTAADVDANGQAGALLGDRLEQLRAQDAGMRVVGIFEAGEGAARAIASSPAKQSSGELESAARSAIQDDRPAHAGGLSRTVAAVPLVFGDGAPSGAIAVEYDTSAVATDLSNVRTRLVLGALVGGCLLGAVVLLLLRRELFRPLSQLRGAMQQIRGGARGVRIGWNRGDELGLVASEFDAMVTRLEATQDELAKYVNTDPLTGLLTREAFTDRFAAELTRARREGYPISLLAIDVDCLDEINRTHDRAAGDQVLADLGSVLRGCTRPTDASGRTGEDSFHVALVGADVAQASVVLARIRSEIAQRVGIGPERTRITCGYGIAEYPRHAVDQIVLERMADAACSQAQRAGRDHALAFGPSGGYVDAATLVPDGEGAARHQSAGARELSSTVHALARALDGIDPVLGGGAHSQRVARYAAAVARELGYGDTALRELRSAAVLHDVGKVAVPPAILRAPADQLDERQRGALHYHAWVSRTMIAGAGLAPVADIVFHLPERWDGAGYPERLREDAIPHASRILRAAELLDDLTTRPGPDGAPLTPFAAAGELKRRAGGELDPDIAVRLARLVREEGLVGNVAAAGEDEAAPASDAEAA